MSQANLNISRELLEGVWNRRDFGIIDKLVHVNHINHDPTEGQFPQGIEGVKVFSSAFIGAFSDVNVTIHEQTTDGDTVTSYVTFNGTHDGELMGVPPSGRSVSVDGTITYRIENGKVTETWAEWDPNDLMRQIGA